MDFYPSGLAVFVIWLIAAGKSLDQALTVTIAFLPLGMLAVVRLPIGGMTPIIAYIAAAGTIALAGLSILRRSLRSGSERETLLISAPGLIAVAFAAYGLVATVFLPRLFRGAAMVFSFDRQVRGTGTRISHEFRGEVIPLGPSYANISQTAYILLGIVFFIVSDVIVRRRGFVFALRALRWAAAINLILGVLDILGLDVILAVLRTAQYALLNEHAIAGVARVIGGFPEASSFGAFSTALGAFFLVYGLGSGNQKDIIIGALTLAFAAAALSSTAILGLALLAVLIGIQVLRLFVARSTRRKVMFGAACLSFTGGFLAFILMVGTSPDRAITILSDLTINKSQSSSGLERGAMALNGLHTFVATWGFGAGIGSIRSNGFGPAMLGSLGIPGVLLFLWFIWSAFFTGQPPISSNARAALRAAQIAALVHLAMMGAASFSVDAGLMFMFFAAIALNSRREAPEPARPDTGTLGMIQA